MFDKFLKWAVIKNRGVKWVLSIMLITQFAACSTSSEQLESLPPDTPTTAPTMISTVEVAPASTATIMPTPTEGIEPTRTPEPQVPTETPDTIGTIAVAGDLDSADCPYQRIAVLGFTDDSESVYVYCLSAEPFIMKSFEIIQREVGLANEFNVSPGGDKFTIRIDTFDHTHQAELYIVDFQTAESELLKFENRGFKSITWSHDQAYLAYITGDQVGDSVIAVRHLESDTESTVLTGPKLASNQAVTLYDVLWLPESDELVLGVGFGSPARSLSGYKIGIECNPTTHICHQDTITELPWVNSESFIYTSGPYNSTLIGVDKIGTELGTEHHLVMKDFPGTTLLDIDVTQYIDGAYVNSPPSLSKETNQLLFTTGGEQLFVFDLNTGVVTPIELTVGYETLYVIYANWLPGEGGG